MVEDYSQPREPLRQTWLRLLPIALGVCALVGAGFLAHYYAPPPTSDLRQQVDQLSSEVQLLQQEQAMPAMVLNRYRNSICYIFGVYNGFLAPVSWLPTAFWPPIAM
jgi:hypothetical protein